MLVNVFSSFDSEIVHASKFEVGYPLLRPLFMKLSTAFLADIPVSFCRVSSDYASFWGSARDTFLEVIHHPDLK